MGFRVNGSETSTRSPDQEYLKGASRLVNPPSSDPEIAAGDGEEDQGERDYVGRILHVADEALRQGKHGAFRHTRRRRIQ